MALDFPANPTDGQVFGSYVWSASKGVWQSREESAAVSVTSPVPPTSASNGDIWIDTSDGIAYFYYSDGNTSQWVELISSGVPSLASKADKSYVDSQDLLKANLSGATFTGQISGTNASFSGSINGVQVVGQTPVNSGSTGGIAIKAPASGTQTSGYIQFVNNAYTAQWAAIEATSAGVMNLSASYVRLPSQPSFLSFRASGNNWSQGTGVLPFFSTKFNTGNHYNTSNYRFTAPVAGVYVFTVHFNNYGTSGAVQQASIRINGSLQYSGTRLVRNGTGDQDVEMAISVYLNAGDYVEPYANLSTSLSFSSGEYWSHFSGHLLG